MTPGTRERPAWRAAHLPPPRGLHDRGTKIAIIGAGNMGRAFATQFAAAGHDVTITAARSATRGPSLSELLTAVERSLWDVPPERGARNAGLRRAVQRVYVDQLLALAADTAAAPDVRAAAQLTLATLRREAAARGAAAGAPLESRAHWQALAGDIAAWERDRRLPVAQPLPPPPGDPFGEEDED